MAPAPEVSRPPQKPTFLNFNPIWKERIVIRATAWIFHILEIPFFILFEMPRQQLYKCSVVRSFPSLLNREWCHRRRDGEFSIEFQF